MRRMKLLVAAAAAGALAAGAASLTAPGAGDGPALAGAGLPFFRARAPERTGGVRGIVSFQGTVRYTGPVPAGEPLDMGSDPYCAGAHQGEPVVAQLVRVDEAGGLADVVVYVKEGLPSGSHPVPQEAELLDQEGCLYLPRVLAVGAGQTLVIRNSDETLHNVHARPRNNRGFNLGQPLKGIEARRSFANPELAIDIQCDIHGWMQAWVSVFDHPFHAVTPGGGGFSLDALPPGDYVLEAWHEALGTRTVPVTVRAGEVAEVAIVFGE